MTTNRIIIYQLFPRLFGHPKGKNKIGGTLDENGSGKFNYINDSALNSISELGATHVWFTGIIEHATKSDFSDFGISKDVAEVVKGQAGSPYAIKDYYDVSPELAEDIPHRMQEFESLIERTHKNGLKAIIDWVPNHLARNYISDSTPEGTLSFGENDDITHSFNPNNNFYYLQNSKFISPLTTFGNEQWHEEPAKVTGNDAITDRPSIYDWYETVKLNYGVNIFDGSSHFNPIPDTWHKMLDVVLFWASKGVDGFRVDMAGMVPLEFWKWALAEIKAKYPNLIFIAEVYEADKYQDFLQAGFDYLYDKVVMYDYVRSVMQGEASTEIITQAWQRTENLHNSLLYFLENHDEQRIASDFFAKNALVGKPAMTVISTMFNNPLMIYMGQELGEKGMDSEGFSGVDGRTTIFDYWWLESIEKWKSSGNWNGDLLDENTKQLRNFYKKLLNIVKTEKTFASKGFYDLMWDNRDNPNFDKNSLYSFLRFDESNCYLVIANFSDIEKSFRLIISRSTFKHIGCSSFAFYIGNDLLEENGIIQFPGEVASINGLGGKILPYSAAIYKLKWNEVI